MVKYLYSDEIEINNNNVLPPHWIPSLLHLHGFIDSGDGQRLDMKSIDNRMKKSLTIIWIIDFRTLNKIIKNLL
jgi:hypothetical protein